MALTEEIVLTKSKASNLSRVKSLNCWGLNVSDITILQKTPNIEVLNLSVNRIDTLKDLANCKMLRELYVRKNLLVDLKELEHLSHLPNLRVLWLQGNACYQNSTDRDRVLQILPNLKKLDNTAVVHGKSIEEFDGKETEQKGTKTRQGNVLKCVFLLLDELDDEELALVENRIKEKSSSSA